MTSVSKVANEGNGKMLASFWEIPALARPKAETAIRELELVGASALVMLVRISEPVFELPVAVNRSGMVLADGLNPVAAAVEAGIEVINYPMSGSIDFGKMRSFWDL